MRQCLVAIVVTLIAMTSAGADEFRPAYLEITEGPADIFDVRVKVPARAGRSPDVFPHLPASCSLTERRSTYRQSDSVIDVWRAECPGGLSDETIELLGVASTPADAIVHYSDIDGNSQTFHLTADRLQFTISAAPSRVQVMINYLRLGVEHILTGIDHLLFVLVLMMAVRGWRSLVATITAFTVAHSVTLVMSTLGAVVLPQGVIEVLIALSIAFAAAEVLRIRHGWEPRLVRRPVLIAFMFGLLHGFGFADALVQIGLPAQAIPLSLFSFNVGVELGQLMFVATIVAVSGVIRLGQSHDLGRFRPALANTIGVIAMFWTIERAGVLFGLY